MQQFPIYDLMVDVKGTTTFEFSDPIAYEQARRDARDEVDVIFSPVQCMKNHVLCSANHVFQEVMQPYFNYIGNYRLIHFVCHVI